MDKNVEKIMFCAGKQKDDEDVSYKALIKTYDYFRARDYDVNTDKSKSFRLLYIMGKGETIGFLRISIECNIDQRTLLRYRHEFVKMFLYFLEKIEGKKEMVV